MSLNKSNIDYLREAGDAINRPGYTLNIVTGCRHSCPYCYARQMVTKGRLKGHPSYPYGFEPTYHSERLRRYKGKPKLLFLNDMADVGGDWKWRMPAGKNEEVIRIDLPPDYVANRMVDFAILNPQHIILLLTKNPSWYRYAEWPSNVWCGFTATTGDEYRKHVLTMEDLWVHGSTQSANTVKNVWVSLEPWLSDKAPGCPYVSWWKVLGGLSGPNARGVSDATETWLLDNSIQTKRFTKDNAGCPARVSAMPREYPDAWRVDAV